MHLNALKRLDNLTTSVQKLFVKTLTAQQLKWRLVVQVNVVKRIGDDFGHPHQASLHIFDKAQVNGSE